MRLLLSHKYTTVIVSGGDIMSCQKPTFCLHLLNPSHHKSTAFILPPNKIAIVYIRTLLLTLAGLKIAKLTLGTELWTNVEL